MIVGSFFVSFGFANAQIIFTEIMYDPPGTDTGREWIEVYNSGTDSVDLTTYKLFENNVNHKITEHSGGKILAPGKYAIIADNVEKFLIDFPNLAGTIIIFDSAFSLNNTGEDFSLIDSAGVAIDTISYSVDLGAKNNGNSLQLYAGVLIPAEPTPGANNKTVPADENSTNDSSSNNSNTNNSGTSNSADNSTNTSSSNNSTHSNQVELSKFVPKINFEINAGRDRSVLVNSPIEFVLNHNQENSSGMNILWTFGDGNFITSRNSLGTKVEHYFDRIGEYNVVINAGYQKDYAVDRVKVTVTEPKIEFSISNSGKHVDLLLKNNTDKEINIGRFFIKTNGGTFHFPQDTILSKNQILIIGPNTTKLNYIDYVDLYYPNGEFLTGQILIPTITNF